MLKILEYFSLTGINDRGKIGFLLIALIVSVAGTGMVQTPGNQEPPPPVPNLQDPDSVEAFLRSSPYVNFPKPVESHPSFEPSAMGTADNYGYRWNDQLFSYNWIEASTGGNDVGFDGDDDAHVGPRSLGFDFKFYEHTYSKIFISTNGYLSFGEGSAYLENRAFPNDGPPNNVIAPFWDDLVVGGSSNSGKVFSKSGTNAHGKYFVVEWRDVTRSGNNTDTLTFEAILYETGDICFQYFDLNGTINSATVGIEDADGVDGSVYLSNASGLGALKKTKALCFLRPAPGPHVKALPAYQSRFTQYGSADFQALVHNIGEAGADVYNLTVESTDNSWGYSLLNGNTLAPLKDSNKDGIVDTGSVGQGANASVLLRLTQPPGATAGSTVKITLRAASTKGAKPQSVIQMRSAVSADFTQVYSDSETDMHMELFSAGNRENLALVGYFTGSTMGLASSDTGSIGSYVFVWERNGNNGSVFFSDIEYMVLNGFGRTVQQLTKLTNNGSASQHTTDHYPAVSIAPNGMTGFIWVRDIVNSNLKVNSNVYFAILGQNGAIAHGPVNLTGNDQWRGGSDKNIPTFAMPRIAATQDNRFVLGWVDDRLKSGGETSDVAYAVYDANGQSVKPPSTLLESNPGGTRYSYPSLTWLEDNRAMFAYTVYDPGTNHHSIGFAVVRSNGTLAKGETSLSGSTGWRPDAVQSSSGEITIAWTDTDQQKIAYAVLNGSDYSADKAPTRINNPDQREASFVSVTKDWKGHVILTWVDNEWNDHLYYALLKDDGTVITPAMIYRTGEATEPLIKTSESGQGNAPKVPGQIFVPMAVR